jgi:predicted enzyme related to lactoylglutathione lyase
LSHQPGTFCWLDLAAPDVPAAEAFYAGVFGWKGEPAGPPELTGGYSFFRLDGDLVAGYGAPGPGEPASWRMYVLTTDADETAAKVRDAGGTVLLEPLGIPGSGRMTVFLDTGGAVCCAWESRGHGGAQAYDKANAFSWAEHATRDANAARLFYGSVFGWKTIERAPGYEAWLCGESMVGGLIEMDDTWPADMEPYWLPYFGTDDVPEAANRVQESGGKVVEPPSTFTVEASGEMTSAVVQDPNGASFGIGSS